MFRMYHGRKTKGSDSLCATEGKQGDTQDWSRSLVEDDRVREQHEETVAISVMK